MSYESTRDYLEDARLAGSIQSFADRYMQRTLDPASRRTIILFPGGMGSSLIRGYQKYASNVPAPNESYGDLWLTISLFLSGLDALGMSGDVDSDQRFIIADGTIQVCGIGPYDIFTEWCEAMQIDLIVFPYDWRRRPGHAVHFFIHKFLPALVAAVPDIGDITLLGHSLGGMTVKMVMQRMKSTTHTPAHAQLIKRYVTVGSPFYGYFGQTIRYFEGEPEFLLYSKKDVAQLIASLEGGYFLQLMDKPTYDARVTAFKNDHFPLTTYPSTDANSGAPADPFHPDDDVAGHLYRYPEWVKSIYLADGLTDYHEVAHDLSCADLKNFYNIRAIQADGSTVKHETYVGQEWRRVKRPFDPDGGPSAITFSSGPGDGTIPAWSSRLLSLQACWPNNVITMVGDLEHMSLMESDAVQNQIYGILGLKLLTQMEMLEIPAKGAEPPAHGLGTTILVSGPPPVPVASVAETGTFVKKLQKIVKDNRAHGLVVIDRQVRSYLETIPRTRRVALSRGIIAAAAGGRYGSHPRH